MSQLRFPLAPTCAVRRNSSVSMTITTIRRRKMAKLHHLQSKLKVLRLGGMTDTLETRLDQAQKDKLGYLNSRKWMRKAETERRSQRSLASRIGKARFQEVKTLQDFDFSFN